MSSKENKGISLDHCVEIYVPNLCLDGKQLPEELRGELLKEVKTKFSSWFGGTSRKEPRIDRIEGSWLHESGELANEPIDIVYSNTDAESLEEYFEELPVLANEIATRLKQEAVAFRVDGKMTLIYGDSSGALERREPKEIELKCALQASLMRVSSLKDIRDLFINLLHYDHQSTEIATLDWPDTLQDLLATNTLPQVIAGYKGFKIIHLQLAAKDLRKGQERQLIQRIRKDDPTLRALFVVSNYEQNQWHLINTKDTQEASKTTLHLRFFRIGKGQQVRTAAERLHLIDIEAFDPEITAQELQEHHNDAFDVESVSQDFFNEISNWYFWALSQVEFPQDTVVEGEEEKHRATSLIRFLTRIIFCWFLKEKGLIPESLFNRKELEAMLVDLEDDHCTYHQGILQNLFFATLNQRMGKDSKTGEAYRAFAKDKGFVKNRSTYGVDTLYRYEEHFNDEAKALGYFAEVPFLNGGLFECLDRTDDDGKKLYLDGFSRNKKKRSRIPNKLFFAPPQTVDLSEIYDDPSRRNSTVRGLLNILHAYNFTVEENTPVDKEIALDPELLGKVFENLLASYNEETKTTARKQTGSFYTPRAIVEYMVDESLKAHLWGTLTELDHEEEEAREQLDLLLGYSDEVPSFSEGETDALLEAIHTCKILDPACGSGAFPIGMLQKLVHVVHKLDPENARWKQLQIKSAENIPDPSAKAAAIKAIERDFEENGDDYGRKLYLIENCLYGVDIQPIAIQISKLRFFISLICDQKFNRDKAKNHGIRALPNLETKFVAANTLIGLPKMDQMALVDPRLNEIEAEIESLYHRHFSIQRRDQKLSIQDKLKKLREELGIVLAQSLGSSQKAEHVAKWDPFDSQAYADFFDPHWMFGKELSDGFDIVIGNPPYVLISKNEFKIKYSKSYNFIQGKPDLYKLFIEKSFHLMRKNGVMSYIIPNSICATQSAQELRKMILEKHSLNKILDFSTPVFGSVAINNVVIIASNEAACNEYVDVRIIKSADDLKNCEVSYTWKPQQWLENEKCEWQIHVSPTFYESTKKIISASFTLGTVIQDISLGMQVYHNSIHSAEQIAQRHLHSKGRINADWIPEYGGRDFGVIVCQLRKSVPFVKYYSGNEIYNRPNSKYMEGPRLIVREIIGERINACFVDEKFSVNKSCFILRSDIYSELELKALLAILVSKTASEWAIKCGDKSKQALFPRISMNTLKKIPIPKSWQQSVNHLASLVAAVEKSGGDEEKINETLTLIDQHVLELYIN